MASGVSKCLQWKRGFEHNTRAPTLRYLFCVKSETLHRGIVSRNSESEVQLFSGFHSWKRISTFDSLSFIKHTRLPSPVGSTIVVWRQTNAPPHDRCGGWICPEFTTWSGLPSSSRWSQFFKILRSVFCHFLEAFPHQRSLRHYPFVSRWVWTRRTMIRWRNDPSPLFFCFLGGGQDADSQFEQCVLRNLWLRIVVSL